jgi:hypothetical protein
MLAVLAVVAFSIALILHLAGGGVEKYVLDAALAGFIALAASQLWPYQPWGRRPG